VNFIGRSDTEVALHSYRIWGLQCLRRFNGIFAFAIWDSSARELLLARDRFGVKPLYFYRKEGGLIFGSEIKALFASGKVERGIDPAGLHEFLYFGSALGRHTILKGVEKLLPGHWLRYKSGRIDEGWFWRVDDVVPVGDTLEIATKRVTELLDRAVCRQLVSEVPVGVFLSGGVDSSAAVALAVRHYRGRLKTFSAGFDFQGGVNELPKARRLAAHFGTEHHEIHVDASELPETIEQLVRQHDEPFSDAANIPLFLICQQLNGEPKVILQGDGSDEIFGGYRRYAMLQRYNTWAALAWARPIVRPFGSISQRARQLDRMLEIFELDSDAVRMASLLTVERRSSAPTRVLSREWREQMVGTDPFRRYEEMEARVGRLDRVQRMLHIDATILLPDIFLEKVDKATMAWGIESRVPFLDNDLTDYVLGLPSAMKIRRGEKKFLLRQALQGVLPEYVLGGPKIGFGVPYAHWLRRGLADYARNQLTGPDCRQAGLFDQTAVSQVLKEHIQAAANHGFLIWKMLNLAIWHRTYLN
jgi:asparagine synthase (glutamine-hydrolysing)